MNATPVVEVCPNCGAPLELDERGKCRWCRAQVRLEPTPGSAARDPAGNAWAGRAGDDFSLVPGDLDTDTDVPFIDLILVTLGYGPTYGVSAEPAVRDYVRGQPGLYQDIRALGAAASAAGVRVRDAGLLKSSFDDNLRPYTPEEIWAFDLAIDVIAMLATLQGLTGGARFRTVSALRDLDADAHGHTWKKALKRAGEGPAEFRELRGRVPRHRPHPARSAGSGATWM